MRGGGPAPRIQRGRRLGLLLDSGRFLIHPESENNRAKPAGPVLELVNEITSGIPRRCNSTVLDAPELSLAVANLLGEVRRPVPSTPLSRHTPDASETIENLAVTTDFNSVTFENRAESVEGPVDSHKIRALVALHWAALNTVPWRLVKGEVDDVFHCHGGCSKSSGRLDLEAQVDRTVEPGKTSGPFQFEDNYLFAGVRGSCRTVVYVNPAHHVDFAHDRCRELQTATGYEPDSEGLLKLMERLIRENPHSLELRAWRPNPIELCLDGVTRIHCGGPYTEPDQALHDPELRVDSRRLAPVARERLGQARGSRDHHPGGLHAGAELARSMFLAFLAG
jgi:hypothetical protein